MRLSVLSLLVLGCGLLLTAISFYAWKRRVVRGALWFSLFMLALAVYVTGYFFELSTLDLPAKLFWNKVQYLGILFLPSLCLLFALHFSRRTARINNWLLALIFTIPGFLLVVKLFDDSLQLFYRDVKVDTSGAIPLLVFTPGPIYYFIAINNLILLAYGLYQIWAARRDSSPLYRKQTSIMVGAGLVIYIVYILYLSGFRPFSFLQNIDFNPFGFTAWALAISYAIMRHRLFDLVPFAREKLIETLTEGVLVFDSGFRLVDANPACREIFGWNQVPLGWGVERVFAGWLGLPNSKTGIADAVRLAERLFEVSHTTSASERWFEIHTTILQEQDHEVEGRLLVMHDTTARKQIEQKLRDLSLEDDLTGLKNRRGFFALASQMAEMVFRMNLSAALVYIDLDDLKTINDTRGHTEGDRAIEALGQALVKNCRSADIVARLGGDEFAVLAVGSEEDFTGVIQNRMEKVLASLSEDRSFPGGLSFSYGVVAFKGGAEFSLDELLVEADRAMYRQKQRKKSAAR